ncbi:hypothetical protein J7438_07165 [Thalassotalea sp. G20_0]|uniref:hypothetical protein n=1 Tax=Thalassotalea sp. G20_0 TaxID=2821093 RepID=UPI001ADAAE32|nr:hypothetical protein [Thalassotalea sp. G20_0]MBO9493865.1 hypothetical protein [Thalassotalea sp. G20_0]
MNSAPVDPAATVTFRCNACKNTFDASPVRTEDEPARAHPYRYFAICSSCGDEVQQVPWQVGIYNANLAATGPKTIEGKAKSSANLSGHPTPQEAQVTRFNALKHGASARTALFFPAKPGKYPHCKNCDVDHDYCREQPACIKRTELTMRHLIAVQSGNPEHLKEMHALQQANVAALFDDMLQAVIGDGVALRNPAYNFDKDGGFHLAQYRDSEGKLHTIEEIKAHPLLKPLFELLSKNNMTLADLNMTQKIQIDQGIQQGQLQQEEDDKEQALDYQRRLNDQMSNLKDMIKRSQKRLQSDPILIEHLSEDAGEPKDIEAEVVDGCQS